jgi:tetratricopeptide (TPR) repeat protein
MVLAALFGIVNWPIVADEGRLNERMERIVWLVTNGDVPRAKALLADTEARHPNRALLLYRVGLAFRDRGDLPDTIEYLSQAQKSDPASPDIRLVLGEALLDEGRPADAIPHLEAARAAGLEPATTSYDLARAYQMLGDTGRARATLASIPASGDLSVQNLLQLGMAALQLEDPSLGERFLAVACRREPGMAAAHRDRGVALGMLGRFADATGELEQATRLDPSDPDAHYNLALLYAKQGRTGDARVQVEETLRLAPAHNAARALAGKLGELK